MIAALDSGGRVTFDADSEEAAGREERRDITTDPASQRVPETREGAVLREEVEGKWGAVAEVAT